MNTRYSHLLPMITNCTSNAILSSFNTGVEIRHSFSPLPRTEQEALESAALSLFWYSFFSIIGWSLIPTSAIVFIVKEKESLVKYQQYISGVGIVSYWMSNLLWDLLKFMFTGSLSLVILYIFDFKEMFYTEHGQLQSYLIGMVLFGLNCFMFI